MRKIDTMFRRDPDNMKRVTSEVTEGCEWVLAGEGVPTVKVDGSACAVIYGYLFRRHKHDASKGLSPPTWTHWSGSPDQTSGHGWLATDRQNPSDRYHVEAWDNYGVGALANPLKDGTYELVGPKVNGNPHHLDKHELWKHGEVIAIEEVPRDFEGLAKYLAEAEPMEGIVFHHPDGRMAKIKRRDFGLPWPVKR